MDKKNVKRLAELLSSDNQQSDAHKARVISFLNQWNGTVAALLFVRASLITPVAAAKFAFQSFQF